MITGLAGRAAIPGTAGIAAVNGAIERMAITLSKELAPLRINIVSPGMIDTPAYGWMPDEKRISFYKEMGLGLSVGRVGQPEEVSSVVLMSMTNDFLTGSVLDIDGGARV